MPRLTEEQKQLQSQRILREVITPTEEKLRDYGADGADKVFDGKNSDRAKRAKAALYKGTADKPTTTARDAFMAYLKLAEQKKKIPFSDQTPPIENPGKNTKKLAEMFPKITVGGKELDGVALFKAAMQEEVNDKAYREGLLKKSTRTIKAHPDAKLPIVTVGGPSSSGKSYGLQAAAQEVSDQIAERLEQLEAKKEKAEGKKGRVDCTVVASDGGDAREVSKMRDLAVRMANAHGFSGISDLQSATKDIMDVQKKYVLNAALESHEVGVAIPETYSTNPMGILTHKVTDKVVDAVQANPELYQPVSVIIKPDSPESVMQSGNERAWDANPGISAQSKTESKKYDAGMGGMNYKAGVRGSEHARFDMEKVMPNVISLDVINDRVLVKPDGNGDYMPARVGEPGVLNVSKRALDRWRKDKTQDLTAIRLPAKVEVTAKGQAALERVEKRKVYREEFDEVDPITLEDAALTDIDMDAVDVQAVPAQLPEAEMHRVMENPERAMEASTLAKAAAAPASAAHELEQEPRAEVAAEEEAGLVRQVSL